MRVISAINAKRLATLDRVSWDSLRLLLVLSEAGSFRAASECAGASLNTIRDKIDRLEKQFNAPLVKRSVEGVSLTQDGHELVSIARSMRVLGNSTERVKPIATNRHSASVNVMIADSLGALWLLPELAKMSATETALELRLKCGVPTDIMFRDVDLSVQFDPPLNPDIHVTRIGALHIVPFAAPSYLKRHGNPTSASDMASHQLVWHEDGLVATELLSLFVDSDDQLAQTKFTTDTSATHFAAIEDGAGIGFLPTFYQLFSDSIQPIDIGIRLKRDIYLVSHSQAPSRSSVSLVAHCIEQAMDAARYPWFGDTFVPAQDLRASEAGDMRKGGATKR